MRTGWAFSEGKTTPGFGAGAEPLDEAEGEAVAVAGAGAGWAKAAVGQSAKKVRCSSDFLMKTCSGKHHRRPVY